MSDFDAAGDRFDRELSAALRAYAAEAPVDMDVASVARLAMQHRAARSRGSWPPELHVSRKSLRLFAIGALLLVATAVTLLAIGSWLPDPTLVETSPSPDRTSFEPSHSREPILADPSRPIPPELAGTWFGRYEDDAAAIGAPYIDFQSMYLLHDWDGSPIQKLGRAVAFERTNAWSGRLYLEAPTPCGPGRYLVTDRYAGDPRFPNEIEFSDGLDSCEHRAAILQRATWINRLSLPPETRPEMPGQRYPAEGFTEAFQFVGYGHTEAVSTAPGMFELRTRHGLWLWTFTFLDDVSILSNPCDKTSETLPDVPGTMESVGDWLRATAGLLAGDPVELLVDGRVALRFDLAWETGCWSYNQFRPTIVPEDSSASQVGRVRVYAIPTGDDIILAVLWLGDPPSPNLMQFADAYIQSVTFD